MNATRKNKLYSILFVMCILALVAFLILYSLRSNISLFYSPTQVIENQAPLHHQIRVGGMVVPGSIVRNSNDLSVQFIITDYQHKLTIQYKGILPDLFREGQGIVAQGILNENGLFNAKEVLAKHDENYMPPEIKASLKKNNDLGGG